jgi:hypothetical protein
VEVGVAYQSQFPARDIACDHVRAGGWKGRANLPFRRRCGDDVGVADGQLVEEVRVGPGQMKGDVPVRSSATIPSDRSQRLGARMQAAAPRIAAYRGAPEEPIANSRSNEWVTSLGRSGAPLE